MKNLSHKIDNAMTATESFSRVLDQETAALKAADYKTFAALQETKMQHAQLYQDAVLAFEEDLDAVKTLPATDKDKLRTAHARFAAASDANQSALKTAMQTAERLVKMIMDAAKRSVMDGPAYSAAGNQGLSDKIPVHFKLNEVL
jgi:flagellar biosynthesis/type III secretory pathway chaperone